MRRAAFAAALLATACGGGDGGEAPDPRAAELACQRRLVGVLQDQPPGRGMSGAFEGARDRYTAMPRDGCSESQRRSAEVMAGLSGRIAESLSRLGPNPHERSLSPEANYRFLELQSLIEQFDRRRGRLIEDLRRMEMPAR